MISFGAVNLWKLEKSDLGIHYSWANNDNIRRLAGGLPQPKSTAEVEQWFASVTEDTKFETYSIKNHEAEMLGWIQLSNLNLTWGTAEVGIVIDEELWGSGYGHDALTAILKYGFEDLRLHRIGAEILSINSPSKRLFEKLGFSHEGVKREAMFTSGRHLDVDVFGLLSRNFKLPKPRKLQG